MTSSELRDRVKEYVETADVRLLKMIEAMAEAYEHDAQELSLTEEQYQILDRRRESHMEGKSKSLTWNEVKQNARKS